MPGATVDDQPAGTGGEGTAAVQYPPGHVKPEGFDFADPLCGNLEDVQPLTSHPHLVPKGSSNGILGLVGCPTALSCLSLRSTGTLLEPLGAPQLNTTV